VAILLLDTSVVVDVLNGKRNRGPQLRSVVSQGHVLASCPVTIAEVYSGMHAEERVPTERLLASLRYYQITPDVARQAGALKYAWARRGRTLSLPDTLIAATAIYYDLRLVTDNVKHYPMPEIQIFEIPA